MSPHQSKTGVYVFLHFAQSWFMFLCFFFFFVLSLVASLFLSFLLSQTFLFPPLSLCSLSSSSSALTIVSRARICVAGDRWPFVPTSPQGPAKNGEKCIHTPGIAARNIGNISSSKATARWWPVRERCISLAAVGDFFEWDARACLERGLRAWDVAPPPWCVAGSVLIWEFFCPRWCHVDTRWCRCPRRESIRYSWNPLPSLHVMLCTNLSACVCSFVCVCDCVLYKIVSLSRQLK